MSFSNRLARLARSGGLGAALIVALGTLSGQAQPPEAQAGSAPAVAQPSGPQTMTYSGPSLILVQPHPSQPEWTKICNGEGETLSCYTTRDFVSDEGQPIIALGLYDIKGQERYKLARVLLPLGLLMQQGIRLAVDQHNPIDGKFSICLPNGCFAEALLDPKALEMLRDGGTLTVGVQNQIGREVAFVLPVSGIAKALDGPAVDPQVLAEQQRKLQEELRKRADEARAG